MSARISNDTRDGNPQWTSELVHAATNSTGIYVELRPPRLAQYVVIKQEDNSGVMTICEVEVFEGGNITMMIFGSPKLVFKAQCLRCYRII